MAVFLDCPLGVVTESVHVLLKESVSDVLQVSGTFWVSEIWTCFRNTEFTVRLLCST